MPVPNPPAKAALPNPSFAAIAKALRRLIAMLMFCAKSAWSCISLSTLNLPFSLLECEPHLPRAPMARPAVTIPVIEPVEPAHRGPSPERRRGNGRVANWSEPEVFFIKAVVHCQEEWNMRRRPSRELGVEALKAQPVGDYERSVGPDLRAGRSLGGQLGDLPLPSPRSEPIHPPIQVHCTSHRTVGICQRWLELSIPEIRFLRRYSVENCLSHKIFGLHHLVDVGNDRFRSFLWDDD